MEITLFSKCIKELIVENDRVDVPYLGTFSAEMMPAAYSDRHNTILPPYRKMSFHKHDIPLADGGVLLSKIRKMLGVSLNQAGVELGWCLSRLCSELEGSKTCKLPGLGTMRANARNEFFFVPDDDLDIWPDGIGFEPISIRLSEKAPSGGGDREGEPDASSGAAGGFSANEHFLCERDEKPEQQSVMPGQAGQADSPSDPAAGGRDSTVVKQDRIRRKLPAWGIVLIALGTLLLLFVAASYLFTEQMSPVLDRLLYSKEELELLRGR